MDIAQTLRKGGLLVPLLLAPPLLDAQIYRWVDDAGVVHFSTTPPPETADRERRVLDRLGIERRVLPAPMSSEERQRQEAEREQERIEAQRREREHAQRIAEGVALESRVRQLHRAYASVDEIVDQRDRRLGLVANNLKLSEGQEATLQRERDRIAAQLDDTRASPENQERYRRELADLDRRVAREQSFQQRQREAMAAIREQAAADIRDYERLLTPVPVGP
ncbi:hypothetical protein TVNIR_0389 [Thioalkalivibrio nitratireducens DSM 14787]|uniref:DUF4124 domain-containing protein n=1 Tax=Thioalkalivibrio nitratireducens (strain DSM 14787 / UNIQEM 213 / ALEN2) TaxID=1255043 RepID=L0DUR6_THIND|nr:DUF4124 domain-containing protein [Thioalkalivibrio nitratireducens]AGA32096.1 hypothetical protein TVNIR_0389 [Thioalkalivibrio nitratireducens DSM 14787]